MRITGSNGCNLPRHVSQAYGMKPAARPEAAAQRLVAGTVTQPPAFDGPAIANRINLMNGALQLYTRAADKIEAAVAVQLGRAIDLRG